jgi:HTH-type transcriptional regulator/antitoxin HigA
LDNGVEKFLRALNGVGVKFLVLSHLQKTYIDGAAFQDDGNPVIVYTVRYNRIDNFWFTVAHELGHVLLHLKTKNDFFLDDLDESSTSIKEKEADDFALKIVKAKEIAKSFQASHHYISEAKVKECCEKLQLHPALIVGYLQHNHALDRRNLNRFKVNVSHLIPTEYWIEKHLDKIR